MGLALSLTDFRIDTDSQNPVFNYHWQLQGDFFLDTANSADFRINIDIIASFLCVDIEDISSDKGKKSWHLMAKYSFLELFVLPAEETWVLSESETGSF